uniref:BTB domain-containing protein n=1 Tax=Globisporangium ultimum (strain ATCC 200006 / CBS 805.95 / DAOM BR144) TaxID=431595 RepID=K3WAD0_GLOUD
MTVYSWGRGEDGQLGLGDTIDQYRPVLVDALQERRIVQIACGSGHTVVLTEEGEVYTWGRGDDGRLGHGDNGWKFVPRLVEELRGRAIRQVTCGSYHTAAVTVSGELYTWGGGMYGKLGHGNETGHSTPYLVESLKGLPVRQVACGSRHTVVLLENKDVYTWGDKENGVSGHGDTEGQQYLPCNVEELRGKSIKQISACGFHTAALSESGDVYTFGEGKFGRLGHNSERNQSVARFVDGLAGKRVKQIACGGFHTAAVTETGQVYTWGGGEHGQLGHGDKINKPAPTLVRSLVENNHVVVQITCGWSHTVALTDTGHVLTWGNGDHGKLGHNDTNKVTVPKLVDVLDSKRVVSVASYNEHTVALVDPIAPLRSSQLTSSYLGDMRHLINDAEFSDVTFLIEGRAVYAHRAILATRSDHFRAMFTSGMRESREHEITLQHLRVPVFLALLEYLYVDAVTVGPEMALELFAAADLYTLERLKGLCELLVQKHMAIENAAALFQSADELHASRLREICLAYMVRHFDQVTKTDAFANLSRDLILEVLQSR